MPDTRPIDSNVVVRPARTPRPGELTAGWRIVVGITWVLVVIALASVWKTSDQLGLSTWWLGPRGDPNPVFVRLLPFTPAVLMILAAINHVRNLAWWGLAASALIVLTGVFDLDRVIRIGLLEIAIGVTAGVVSLTSLSGTYRLSGPARSDTEGTSTDNR